MLNRFLTVISLSAAWVLLLLPSIANADIIRVKLSVLEVHVDDRGTAPEVGTVLGYFEYDDANLISSEEHQALIDAGLSDGDLGWYTNFTDFSLDYDGQHFGMADLGDNFAYLYENDPGGLEDGTHIDFSVSGPDFHFVTSSIYSLESSIPMELNGQYRAPLYEVFRMDIGATVVPLPAAAYLFGSGLGLLGWFRRRQTA